MVLNGVPVIQDLDIFARVGKAVAHDEVVPFTVEGQQLSVRDATIDFDGTLSIQFAKVSYYTNRIGVHMSKHLERRGGESFRL